MSEYSQKIEKEIESIKQETLAKNPTCNEYVGNNFSKASLVFDRAIANISQMQYTFTDFGYNINTVFKAEKSRIYERDVEIFSRLEKKISNASEVLAKHCGLDDIAQEKYAIIVQEVYEMRSVFQQTSYTTAKQNFSHIRPDNQQVALGIIGMYNPGNVDACTPKSKTQKNFFDTLSSAFDIGSKKEDALKSWKKAASLITGTFGGGASVEYDDHARKLLSQELERQGFTLNAKNAMLRNFDCYKTKVDNSQNVINNFVARAECLSVPIAGTDRIFRQWDKFVLSSPDTQTLQKRQETAVTSYHRAVNIHEMYNTLQAIIADAQDTNDTTRTHLIQLHQALLETNEKLESRIPSMQKNCMKGNPDIVGGCK